jgi:hypothetical protein
MASEFMSGGKASRSTSYDAYPTWTGLKLPVVLQSAMTPKC